MQPLLALLVVDGGDEHAAGVDAHHLPRRQVGYGDAGLADELLGLVIGVDAAEDDAVGAAAVVEGELEQLLALLDRLAGLDLDDAEVALGEGLKVHVVGKEGLYLYLGEVDDLLRLDRRGGGSGSGGALGLLLGLLGVEGLHRREYYLGIIVTSHKFL